MSKTTQKPKKPRPDFPLYSHRNGQWAKKIRGKTHFFGKWNDPQAALGEYLRIEDELQAGRIPTPVAGVVTLADVCNQFLERSQQRQQAGEISGTTFGDYVWCCRRMVKTFGRTVDPEQLRPADFARLRRLLAASYAPSRLSKAVTVTRMVIRWAHESELIDRMPRFGPDFKVAGKRASREARAAAGKKLFTADEIRRLSSNAEPTMKAMVLLGVNGGFGNTDVASLPLSAVDLENGWVDFPRPKTGVLRRFLLWPETTAALREAMEARPEPASPEFADLTFLTAHRRKWVVVEPDGRRSDQVVLQFRKLLRKSGISKPRCGFYWLRHTFQTIADDAGDPIATAHVMGHADGTIGGVYRERISDERLRKVTDHVRQWLFGESKAKPKRSKRESADNPVGDGKPSLRVVG